MKINKFLSLEVVNNARLPGATRYDKLVGALGWNYLEFHKILDGAGMFLDDDEVARIGDVSSMFLCCWQKLHEIDNHVTRWTWKIRPKMHALDHLVRSLTVHTRLNPKHMSCLMEENFLGKMKRIGKATRGGSALQMSVRTLQRYVLCMSLRWHRRKTESTFLVDLR
jgi:hypothetical protein